jgi:hypothetical protein
MIRNFEGIYEQNTIRKVRVRRMHIRCTKQIFEGLKQWACLWSDNPGMFLVIS